MIHSPFDSLFLFLHIARTLVPRSSTPCQDPDHHLPMLGPVIPRTPIPARTIQDPLHSRTIQSTSYDPILPRTISYCLGRSHTVLYGPIRLPGGTMGVRLPRGIKGGIFRLGLLLLLELIFHKLPSQDLPSSYLSSIYVLPCTPSKPRNTSESSSSPFADTRIPPRLIQVQRLDSYPLRLVQASLPTTSHFPRRFRSQISGYGS